ncbi:CCCH zinc finger domain protein [Penicillium malachiteum]|uniref:CCCH zinc finger domain protein n=1 Tax=Penicillium malachiteum TaxID=1324776 RepID=A0AAD6HBE7_9EURO|nr:CCCH zinc finger domain protein [Penicillium malachiteum]
MAVCKFFQQGRCRYGDACKFEHPGRTTGLSGNRFGALSGGFGVVWKDSAKEPDNPPPLGPDSQKQQSNYNLKPDDIKVDLTAGQGRPQWVFSAYAPLRDLPRQLFGGPQREQSMEEMRLRHYQAVAAGNPNQAVQEAQALYEESVNQMNNALNDINGAIKYITEGANEHPNRIDITEGNTAPTQNQAPAAGQSAFGQPAFGQPSAPNQASNQFGGSSSGWGQPSQPVQPAQPAFGAPSAFGQPATLGQGSAFGQPSTLGQGSAFGQPSSLGQGSAFGQPSNVGGQSAFGKPAFGQSAFAQAGNNQPGFGQPAFGQPSAPAPAAPAPFGSAATASPFGAAANQQTNASPFGQVVAQQPAASGFGQPSGAGPFGQPSTNPSPFGQPQQAQPTPFGQPSAPAATNAFGQPSAPAANNAFGQPSAPAANNAFGQPSAPAAGNPFGAPSKPAAPFGQPAAPQGVPVSIGDVGPPAYLKSDIPGELTPVPRLQGETRRDPNTKRLTMWKGQRVEYVNDHPCYIHPEDNKTLVRINFPDGPPDPGTFRQSQGEPQDYTPEIEEMYKYFLANGCFKDGVIPKVPPKREWISFDF